MKSKLIFTAAVALLLSRVCCADGLTAAPGGGIDLSAGGRARFTLKRVESLSFKPSGEMMFGFFKMRAKGRKAEPLEIGGGGGEYSLRAAGSDVGKITAEKTASGAMRVSVDVPGASGSAGLKLYFACAPGDRFWGFGEQYNRIDFRGREVPVWQSEQGVGRAEKSPAPPRGSFSDTYFPMPYFLDPSAGKGFLLENTEYSEFDNCAAATDTWSVEVWNPSHVSFVVLPGPSAADVVSQLTAEVGRPEIAPPDWVFSGVWLASQRGPEVLLGRVEKALAAGIPVSAVWAQDWLGERHFGTGNFGVKYRWEWDPELYPDLPGLIANLRKRNIRFLGYFNPFVVPDYGQYAEGAAKGYLVKNKSGAPYDFQIVTFKGGLLDVTNPEAAEWFKGYAREAVRMGMSGWMCDFGEWLPFDAVTHGGGGAALHNTYATGWHRLSLDVLREAYPDGDFALLTRSGFTGEQRVAQIVWAGDQEQDWKGEDGLPTVVAAALTSGMSGVPFFTTDIAGFSGGPSTKELFMRWTELGAFMPVMRTHDGLKKFENHRFDSDAETLAHFSRMARAHSALLPYFKSLAAEAVAKGLPMIRHTALVDPGWDKSLEAGAQWMVGNDILFAPVTAQGAAAVRVFFPEGEWENIFTGEEYHGRTVAEVSAPIGAPAVFARKGKLADVVKVIRSMK